MAVASFPADGLEKTGRRETLLLDLLMAAGGGQDTSFRTGHRRVRLHMSRLQRLLTKAR